MRRRNRTVPPHRLKSLALFLLVVLLQPAVLVSTAEPVVPNRGAAKAFLDYVRATEARNNSELQRGASLLWIDELSEAERKRAYADLAEGGVKLEQRSRKGSGDEVPCPGCMIHHWEGLVFIPGARLDDVLRILEDYDHHAEYYAPDVERSRIESRDDHHYRVFLRFRRQKVITVVLNTEHDVVYTRDSASRAHSRSSATHIGEVENPGKGDEREKSRGADSGFLWGMETWWRLEDRDNGVYVQSEVVSLTRNIPAGLGWMIGPFVTAVPRESLTFTLQATRKAVLSQLRARSSSGAYSPGFRRDFSCAAIASSFRNSLACADQENFFAVPNAFAAMVLRNAGSSASLRIASPSSCASCGSFRTMES